jgi:hypothetical protein
MPRIGSRIIRDGKSGFAPGPFSTYILSHQYLTTPQHVTNDTFVGMHITHIDQYNALPQVSENRTLPPIFTIFTSSYKFPQEKFGADITQPNLRTKNP